MSKRMKNINQVKWKNVFILVLIGLVGYAMGILSMFYIALNN